MGFMLSFCTKTTWITPTKTEVDTSLFPRAVVLGTILCPAGLLSFTSYYSSLLPQQWTGAEEVCGAAFLLDMTK